MKKLLQTILLIILLPILFIIFVFYNICVFIDWVIREIKDIWRNYEDKWDNEGKGTITTDKDNNTTGSVQVENKEVK